jgi:hypothetical protein
MHLLQPTWRIWQTEAFNQLIAVGQYRAYIITTAQTQVEAVERNFRCARAKA